MAPYLGSVPLRGATLPSPSRNYSVPIEKGLSAISAPVIEWAA